MNDGRVTGRIRTPARVSGRVAAAAVGASERTRRARCRDVAAASRRAARRLRTRGGQSARGGSAVVSVRRGSVPRGCEKPLSTDRATRAGPGARRRRTVCLRAAGAAILEVRDVAYMALSVRWVVPAARLARDRATRRAARSVTETPRRAPRAFLIGGEWGRESVPIFVATEKAD